MSCEHNDCFTCPYSDCISDMEPQRKKPGRKPLPLEERQRRRKEYNARYNKTHQVQNHNRWVQKSEGIVKKRYNTKIARMAESEDKG